MQYAWCLYKVGNLHPDTQGESHVMMDVEIGVMLSEAKECLGPPEAERYKGSFLLLQRRHSPANPLTADFWPPEL